jgi:hypothetical protein
MAVTLKFLSRAPCTQQLLAASPKVLSAVTPKTPAKSPLAACSPAFFSSYERTPVRSPVDTSVLGFGALPMASGGALRRAVETSQELAASVRPSAESARQHFLARRALRFGEATCAESQGGLLGSGLPTLLRQQDAAVPAAVADEEVAATSQQELATSAREYAERAHEHFLARQARQSGARLPEPASSLQGSKMPTLLGHRHAESAAASSGTQVPVLPVLLGHSNLAAAEMSIPAAECGVAGHAEMLQGDVVRAMAVAAQQSFLMRQQSIASRSATFQMP